MGVLDIVQVQHHVVAHFQGEVQSFDFFASRRIGSLGGVQRSDTVADRGAVYLHEHDAQSVGNVFHQSCFAVTGRRNQ